jgi:hypothetical protein
MKKVNTPLSIRILLWFLAVSWLVTVAMMGIKLFSIKQFLVNQNLPIQYFETTSQFKILVLSLIPSGIGDLITLYKLDYFFMLFGCSFLVVCSYLQTHHLREISQIKNKGQIKGFKSLHPIITYSVILLWGIDAIENYQLLVRIREMNLDNFLFVENCHFTLRAKFKLLLGGLILLVLAIQRIMIWHKEKNLNLT